MRRELIAQQGFIRTTVGYCRQSTTPTPTNPVPITTIAGELEWDSTLGEVVANSQWYQIDGADKTQYLPLLLEGDTIEVNYRTMKAKITHRYRLVKITTTMLRASTSNIGALFVGSSSPIWSDTRFLPKWNGKIFCPYCVYNPTYSYGVCKVSATNNVLNFWVSETEITPSDWMTAHPDFYCIYELDTPWVEEIDLTEKLRNHPLMEYGNGIEHRTLNFEQGYIDNTGSLINDSNYITSDFIEGNFRINCNTGYRIVEAHLFDSSDNLVSWKFFENNYHSAEDYNYGGKYEYEIK